MSEHRSDEEEKDDQQKEPEPDFLNSVWPFIGIAVAIFICFLIIRSQVDIQSDGEKWGQYGDSFGVINSLISALAFAAIAYSVIIQRRDFDHQLREFKESVEAQKESSQALKAQLKEMQEQTQLSFMPFPVLVNDPGGRGWACKNMGTSLALNISLCIFDVDKDKIDDCPIGHLDAGASWSLQEYNKIMDNIDFAVLLTLYADINERNFFMIQYKTSPFTYFGN
jgi:hypothetical protein